MNLQVIKSIHGKAEYVLLPIKAYEVLEPHIQKLVGAQYEPCILKNHVINPVALARMNAELSQKELAALIGVSQPYISKLESQEEVPDKSIQKVLTAIRSKKTS